MIIYQKKIVKGDKIYGKIFLLSYGLGWWEVVFNFLLYFIIFEGFNFFFRQNLRFSS